MYELRERWGEGGEVEKKRRDKGPIPYPTLIYRHTLKARWKKTADLKP